MFLRCVLSWGRGGRPGVGVRGCGASGGGRGCVWGGRLIPPKPPPIHVLGLGASGIHEVARTTIRGENYLHTTSLSSTAFTWSRRRRRRRREVEEEAEGHLSICSIRHFSNYSGGDDGGTGIKDDDAQAVEFAVDYSGVDDRGGGDFSDTVYHRHNTIKDRDIGVRVNVGESVIGALDRHFHIPREQALAMVRLDTFLLVSDTSLLHTLQYLKDLSISREQLMRIPWIMLHSTGSLQNKIRKLQDPHLFRNAEECLGFCWFSLPQINKYQQQFARESRMFPNHPNRIYYLAERLEVQPAVLVEKIVKPKQILKMDINRADAIINILKQYGVRMEDLVSDLWVLNHNRHVTEDRLRQAVEAGCIRPKPWICHSSPQVFERYMERTRARSQVLGEDGDLVSYLSDRLSCPEYEVRAAFRRNPGLKAVHVGKMRDMIDLLFSEGFTKEDLRSCLRVLQYSEKRTRRRIKELKSLGHFPFPIAILYKQPSTYFNFVEKIRRKKEEEEKKKREERRQKRKEAKKQKEEEQEEKEEEVHEERKE